MSVVGRVCSGVHSETKAAGFVPGALTVKSVSVALGCCQTLSAPLPRADRVPLVITML